MHIYLCKKLLVDNDVGVLYAQMVVLSGRKEFFLCGNVCIYRLIIRCENQALVLEKSGRRSREYWMKWRSCTSGFPVLLGGDPAYHIVSVVPPSIGCTYRNIIINTQETKTMHACKYASRYRFVMTFFMFYYIPTKKISEFWAIYMLINFKIYE